jgi:hypothetical protein
MKWMPAGTLQCSELMMCWCLMVWFSLLGQGLRTQRARKGERPRKERDVELSTSFHAVIVMCNAAQYSGTAPLFCEGKFSCLSERRSPHFLTRGNVDFASLILHRRAESLSLLMLSFLLVFVSYLIFLSSSTHLTLPSRPMSSSAHHLIRSHMSPHSTQPTSRSIR